MIPKIITQPSAEALTIAECRSHLNLYAYDVDSDGVYSHPDDDMILDMQTAAREMCEDFTGLSLVRKTYEVAIDEFPEDDGAIELPMPPLVSVTSINVGVTSDALMTSDEYVVDDYSRPARILPATTWPVVTTSTNLVKVRYEAGFGEDSDGGERLPYAARAAILVTLTYLYENRGGEVELPPAAIALLRPLRIRLGMA